MARRAKGSSRIEVNAVEYRWRATGNDGWISVTIWPADTEGPAICASLAYHETMEPDGPGQRVSRGDQIVVTNRIVRRIIEFATERKAYSPVERGEDLKLLRVDELIDISDAKRADTQRHE